MFALAPCNLQPGGLPVTPGSVQSSESDVAPALKQLRAGVKD